MNEQGAGESAGRQGSRELSAIELSHAGGSAGEGAIGIHRDGEHLGIGQSLAGPETVHLTGMKVYQPPIDGAHPEVRIVAGQRSDT